MLVCLGASTACAGELIKGIHVDGLERTSVRVVERELPFKQGDTWQENFQQTSEKRLRNLGLFSEAYVHPPDHDGFVNIQVHERWSLWLLPEASRADNGASSAGFALTEHNLWGLHHYLRLSSRWDTGKNFSQTQGRNYQANYGWERIADSRYSADLGFNQGSSRYDAYLNGVYTSRYLQTRKFFSLGVTKALNDIPDEGWSVRLGLALDHARYSLKSGPALADVQGHRKHSFESSLRYRNVNDHITWVEGEQFEYYSSATVKQFGSTLSAWRQSLTWKRYMPIGDSDTTLNYRLSAGWLIGNILRDGLFDIGSRDGLRGYVPGELQGNYYLFGTLEGRMPLSAYPNVQLAAYTDAGHMRQINQTALGKTLVVGTGVGARWTLRWLVNGTIRADAAYGWASKRWRYYLGTQQAF